MVFVEHLVNVDVLPVLDFNGVVVYVGLSPCLVEHTFDEREAERPMATGWNEDLTGSSIYGGI